MGLWVVYRQSITMADIFRDIFLAFIRVHLLHHAEEGPIYGLEMLRELARHGYDLSPGTLYPVLHGLEKAGYLVSEQQTVQGKIRKYYNITESRRAALALLRPKIHELVNEVVGKPERPMPVSVAQAEAEG